MALAKLGKLLVAHHHDVGGDRRRPRMEARPMIPPGAAMSSEQAHMLAATGRLLIACKHCDDRIEMMVRSPPSTRARQGDR
jgi:hypothetical protein